MPLLNWFDLNGSATPIGPAAAVDLSLPEQLLLYLVVVAGVVLSDGVAMARRGTAIRIELSRPWLVVACVIALVVFPAVWREIGAMAEASLLVQMGVAAQGGVFWGVILAGAEKGLAGAEDGIAGTETGVDPRGPGRAGSARGIGADPEREAVRPRVRR